MTETSQETINLSEVFKVAEEAVNAYAGSEELKKQVLSYEIGLAEKRGAMMVTNEAVEKTVLRSIERIKTETIYHLNDGLLSTPESIEAEDSIYDQKDIDDARSLMSLFGRGFECTKQQLAEKLAQVKSLATVEEDMSCHQDSEDLYYHQLDEHSELLAQTVIKAVQKHFGISSVAVSPRKQGDEGRA